jgi:HSP20 family protein
MAVRLLFPFQKSRPVSRWPESADPLSAFRRDMNRIFEEFLTGFGATGALAAAPQAAAAILTPHINVSETDQEIRVTAELPGLEEEDVEVTLAGDSLTISGEKAAEHEETEGEGEDERSFHVVERSAGAFSRTLQLPFSVEPDEIVAVFKNGVLTITIAKPQEVQQKVRKIAVKGADAPPLSVDRAAAGDKPGEAAGKASQDTAQ